MRPSRLHDSTLRHFYWSNADDIKRRSSAQRKKWMRPTRATRFEQRPSVSYVSIRPLTAVVSHRSPALDRLIARRRRSTAAWRREAQSRMRQKNEAFKSFEDLREARASAYVP